MAQKSMESKQSKLITTQDYKKSVEIVAELEQRRNQLKESLKRLPSSRDKSSPGSSSFVQDSKSIAERNQKVSTSVINPATSISKSTNKMDILEKGPPVSQQILSKVPRRHNRGFPSQLAQHKQTSDVNQFPNSITETPVVNSSIVVGTVMADSATLISPAPVSLSANNSQLESVIEEMKGQIKMISSLCEEFVKFRDEIKERIKTETEPIRVHTEQTDPMMLQQNNFNTLLRNTSSRGSLLLNNSQQYNYQVTEQLSRRPETINLETSRIRRGQHFNTEISAENMDEINHLRFENKTLQHRLRKAESFMKILKHHNYGLIKILDSQIERDRKKRTQNQNSEQGPQSLRYLNSTEDLNYPRASNKNTHQEEVGSIKNLIQRHQRQNSMKQPELGTCDSIDKMVKAVFRELDSLYGIDKVDQRLQISLKKNQKYQRFMHKLKRKLQTYFGVQGWTAISTMLAHKPHRF